MHDYYIDGLCNDLSIQVSRSTQSLLNNYGILFKLTSMGAVLLFESTDEAGTAKIPIEEPLKLTFFYSSNSSYFTNFTNVSFGTRAVSLYYFNNKSPIENGQNHTIHEGILDIPVALIIKDLKLTKSASNVSYIVLTDIDNNDFRTTFGPDQDEASIKLSNYNSGLFELRQYDITDIQIGTTFTFYYNREASGSLPFSVFELFIDDSYDTANPINFIFNFESRPTYWRYNILKKEASNPITEDDLNADSLSIIHKPEDELDTILFNDASGSDPIVIRSTNQIKLKQKGVDKIGLFKSITTPIILNLTNPAPDKLEKEGDDWYSDIYVNIYV